MSIEDAYLFETHSKAEIARCCAGLYWFRFCRAYGGHVNDGDSLKASIKFSSEGELLHIMRLLGINLNVLPPDNPGPVPGKQYSMAEFEKFKIEIKSYPQYEQPGWQRVLGGSGFVRVEVQHINIGLSGEDGDIFAVTEHDFENGQTIEKHLKPYGLSFVPPPKGCNCICQKANPAFMEKD